jgi:hypothetical protein
VYRKNVSEQSHVSASMKAAYTDLLPITKEKKQDLLSLCSSKAIPDVYHDFCINLPVATASVSIPFQQVSDSSTQVQSSSSTSLTPGKRVRKRKVPDSRDSASTVLSPVLSSTPVQSSSFVGSIPRKRLRNTKVVDSSDTASTMSSHNLTSLQVQSCSFISSVPGKRLRKRKLMDSSG